MTWLYELFFGCWHDNRWHEEPPPTSTRPTSPYMVLRCVKCSKVQDTNGRYLGIQDGYDGESHKCEFFLDEEPHPMRVFFPNAARMILKCACGKKKPYHVPEATYRSHRDW
jgi:hypothetical protein